MCTRGCVSSPFDIISDAHAKLLGARLHGAPDHEAVAWLKHVQGAGDCGERHGADKNGHFLVQAEKMEDKVTIRITIIPRTTPLYSTL